MDTVRNMALWWLAIVSAVSILSLYVPVSGKTEHELIEELKNWTSPYARPVGNSSEALHVVIDVEDISLIIDEQENILTFNSHIHLRWKDKNLVWDPELYDGIKYVTVDKKHIWTPDLHLKYGYSELDIVFTRSTVYVDSGGDVHLLRPSTSKVFCFFDSLNFPFDTAHGSVEYDTLLDPGYVIFNKGGKNVSDVYSKYLLSDHAWICTGGKVIKNTVKHPCCKEPLYTMSYEFKFHRDSDRYVNTLVIPSFLLSILTVLLFMVPNYSSGRTTLGVVFFCCFFVLLVYTSSLVPDWHHIPYFVRFLFFNLIVISMFTFLNSFVDKLSNVEDGQKIPKIVRTIMFEYVARIFCMKSMVQRSRWRQLVPSEYRVSVTSENEPIIKGEDVPPGAELETDRKQGLEEDVNCIRTFIEKMKDGEQDNKLLSEWKDLAAVVNRMFFILYLTIVLIAIVLVYTQISKKLDRGVRREGYLPVIMDHRPFG